MEESIKELELNLINLSDQISSISESLPVAVELLLDSLNKVSFEAQDAYSNSIL